ncbi:Hydrocephalus-inducing, partial [Clonorchis sinensis]
LKNTSLIPMEFALRVQKKASTLIGTDCRTCSSSESCANPGTHFEKDQTDNSVTTRRVRFTESNDLTVQPSAGLIDPVSSTNLMIFCSPTELGLQEYMVMIDVVGVGQAIEKIPVKTRCVCPSITISPKELNLRRCFLRHPYPVTFTLTNQSEHPASFQLTDLIASTNGKEETENENELEYCATQTEGKIDALGTVVLPITFKAKTLGRLERDVKINICGLEQNPLVAHVSCTGEGPVLFIEPTSLNWGTIPVLEASERTVKITNESAIPASFTIRMEPYDTLKTQLQTLNIKNDSGIPLTCRLEVPEPFYLVVDGAWISNQVLPLDANEQSDIQVLFDPTYKDDLHSRSVEKLLQITFAEHPSMNAVQLFGEVLFPNLIFDTEAVRFGYILNHTEITRHVLMTNPSPLPVRYRWTFLVGNEANIVFRRQTRIQEPYLSPLHSHRVIEGDASKDEAERPLEAKEEEELVDRSLQERNGVDSPSLRIDTNEANGNEQSGTPQNTILEVLLEQDHDVIPLGIEEIFDITPVFGELAPGATQSVSFVFYGHADIEASVRAICEVDGGPTYTMEVSGGASQIRYYLDRQVVEFEPARFDRTVTQELELSNTGQVDFGYAIGPTGITDSVLNVVPAQLKEYQVNTGQLTVEPATGYLASGETRFIRISYLARKPETFVKYLQLQVGHFEPQTIVVRGVADFPRVNLDLPRFYSIERSEPLRLKRTNTKEEPNDIQELTVFESSMGNLLSALYGGVQELVYEWEKHTDVPLVCSCRASAMMQRSSTPEHHLTRRNDLDPIFCHGPKCFVSKAIQLVLHGPLSSPRNIPDWILQRIPDIPFQMEAERFHICDLLEQRTLTPDVWISVDAEENISTRPYRTSFDGLEISSSSKKLQLPSYLLDFGVVVFGTVARRVVRTINTGYEPVSFRFEPTSLKHAEHVGFTPSISRIRNLPGAPEHDWIEWEIAFDPKGANVPTGLVETKLMINILHGPLIPIHLRAQVVVPVIEAHLKNINFGHVQRGEARLMTVQLENPSPVTVNWSHFVSSPLNRRCIRPVDKHPAFNPPVFEVIPKQGKLEAGEKTNIQIKFAPTEQKVYGEQITLKLSESSEILCIQCHGQGLEPQLTFEMTMIQFPACLPFSQDNDSMITVTNPCDFPIEFYSTDFDPISYEQDQILRSLGGYDTHGLLLLPPRKPGEGLPEELVSYYDQLMTKEMEKSRDGTDGPEDSDEDDDASFLRVDDERKLSRTTTSLTSAEIVATTFNSNFSGSQVEPIPPDLLPVSLAISRYLGVNQTSEALKKAQKAGIVIIVHGALAALRKPFIQKLVKEYQSTVLSVDQIVLEALATSFTEAANRARQLCMEAGRIHIKMEGVIPSGSCETAQKPSDNDDESAEHSMGKLERSSIQTSVVFQEQEDLPYRKSSKPPELTKPTIDTDSTPRKMSTHAQKQEGRQTVSSPLQPTASPQMASGPPSRRISLTGILPSGAPIIALSPSPFEGETNTLSPEELGSHFMYSTLLPDDLIICLIQERISAGDCHKGIIFDGLDCSFTKSRLETARLILKTLQDRQYVYAVSAISEFSHFKALEEQVLATQTVMQMAREAARQKYADEITESEYNDLSEEERQEVNELRIRLRKEKRQVELEQQRLREEQERIEQEAELKRLELEHAHRRKGRRSLEKVSGLARPQTTTTTTTKLSESGDQKQPVSGSVMASLADSSQTERLQSQSESRHRVSHGSARQRQAVSEEPGSNESDRLLHQIFKAFNAEFPSICALFGKWDRVTSTEQQLTVSDDMYEGPSSLGVRRHRIEGSARGSSVGGPSKTRKSGQKRDSTEVKNVSPLLPVYCDQVDQTKLIAEQAVDSTPTDLMVPKETINVCPTLGVTHLVINAKPELISNILEDTRKEISPTAINAENPPPIRSTRSEALSVDDIFVKRFQQGESSEYPPFALLMQYLPPPEEIWDYLGLSKKMPTLEGPVDFSVVQYPPPRSLPVQPVSWLSRTPSESSGTRSTPTGRRAESSLLTYFQFYPSGCGDPVPVDQKAPEALRLPEETQIDEQSLKSPPQAGKKFRSPRVESGASSVATARKKSSPSRGRHRTGASSRDTTPTDITISLGEHASRTASPDITGEKDKPLRHFRWIVPAKGEVRLKLRFLPNRVGHFDQVLNFELLGTRRVYQLYLHGECALPNICREPRVIYSERKRNLKPGEIVHRTYITDTRTFEFGPLLLEKGKERVLEGHFPENKSTWKLVNISPLTVEMNLGLLDVSADNVFAIQPNSVALIPGASTTIDIMAFPRAVKRYEATIVCTIKENPETFMMQVACDGAIPLVEVDKKVFNFEKVLIQRKETRTINLYNPTQLPVQWKLSGVDHLGEEFSVPQDSGIIEPGSEFPLELHFRAMKPFKSGLKRHLRFEVYDLENLAGVIQVEAIQVIAEAYDVLLDISFPKGSDGGIDFGILKVGEEAKHPIILKNKGPYEVSAELVFENRDRSKPNPQEYFAVTPNDVKLLPTDKPAVVSIFFYARNEYHIEDEPVLCCRVIDSNSKGGSELIACIPIRLSARSVFSSFSITPVKEVNFGAIAVSSQKTEQVVIENCGQHEFRFSCVRMEKMMELVKLKQQIVSKIKSQPAGSTGSRKQRTEMPLLTIPQPRLQAGLFTISPASGSIPPGGTQTINIDCSAESQGISQEEIAIEISDRNATLYPYGVPFTLKAEAHMPSIETDDITTIFEEHRICHDLSMLDSLEPTEGDFHGGVYAVAENRFIFPSILVGTAARARFCMANRGKVPADVTFEIRPIGHLPPRVTRRPASRGNRPASSTEMFSLEMERTQIDPYTSTYVTVTFTPQAMQKYVSNFLVYLENPSSSTVQPTSVRGATVAGPKQPTTGVPVLNFELIGQGHLPSLTVVEPGVRGRQGQIICAFKRVHVGRQVKRRLLLRNSGALNCGVNLTLVDEDHVFYLEPEKENDALLFIDPDSLLPGCSSEVEYSCLPSAAHEASAIQMYTASILIRPGREYTLNLYYRPIEPGLKSIGQLKLLVVNNPYEDTSVELIGNALADEVCIQDLPQLDPLRAEYIHEALRRRTPEIGSVETVSSLDKSWDDIQILRDLQHNHLDFGDCAVSEELSHTFTMTHCGPVSDQETATSFRFCWPTDHRNLQFIPTKGHLHPKQSRRITVKFRPNSRPVTLQTIPINCTLKRIRVPIPEGCTKPPDWDDTKQVIKWIDAVPYSPKPKHSTAENRGGAITSSASASRTMPQEHPVSEYGTTTEVARRKRKVVETEPEPTFSEIPEVPDPQPLTLLVSAVADFARFSCSAESVSFQNTLMFQRRTHRFELSNIGVVDLHFSWLVEMLTSMPSSNESEVPTPLLDSEETKVKCWDVSLVPFSVQPLHGIVPPGRSISVEVAFSPLVAGTFAARLRGMFENLIPSEAHGENTGPMVQLEGIAEQPFIHFDLCESNYLVGDRRNPDRPGPAGQPLGGPLDPATRVIELWTIGVGTTVSKCFSVANLTSENLDFEIQNQDGWTANDYKPVICTTSHGQITSGRSTELQFTFTPSTLGITESFWRLYIEQLQFAVPLLVVGHTREPQVTWDRSHLNLKSVLVGHTISRDVYLVNHESASDGIHEPLQFKFLDSSRYGPGRQDWIMVQPMSGHVNPGDRVPVKISFTAKAERSINIKLLCKVKYCERPLAVNVKAEGYSMSISVFVESANEQKSTVELQPLWTPCLGLDIDQIVLEVNNTIQSNFGKYHRKFGRLDFGELDPGEVVTRRVTVLNCGKFGCDYAWMCSVNQGNIMNNAQLELAHSFLSAEPDQSRGPIVKVAPVSGNLQPGENVVCTFTFSPPKQLSKCLNQKLALDGLISACLAIREGPAYGLQLTGRTSGRLLEFSTSVIDFGSQLVSRPGLEPAVRCLTLSNIHPSRSISVECLTPNSDVFQYSMRPTVLQPKAVESQDGKTNSANVWFTFTPKACKQYEEKFTFEVNGSTLYTIRLLGTGIKLRIQPVIGPLLILTSKPNGQQRCIKCADTKPDEMSTVVDLGSLRKNQQARRCVTLINKSAAPIAIYRVKVESIVFEESRTAKSKSNQGGEISSASCSLLSKELQIRLCNPVSEDYQLGLAPISTVPLF